MQGMSVERKKEKRGKTVFQRIWKLENFLRREKEERRKETE